MSFGLSLAMAPSKDIDTAAWFSMCGIGHALADYATVFAGVMGWAVFATTLAVIFRSVPLALGVGFAWAGPFENIIVDSWATGYRVFPGQVLAAIIQGGTPEISLGRAAVTGVVYVEHRRGRHHDPPVPKGRHLMITALATNPVTSETLLAAEHWHRDGDWFPWFPLVPLLFFGLWVFVFALVFRRRWRMAPGQSGEAVLAERYARGEIDESEYRQRRSVLRRK